MQPHNSQSSFENATPSSGTNPLAHYQEVPPPPPGFSPIIVFDGVFDPPFPSPLPHFFLSNTMYFIAMTVWLGGGLYTRGCYST